LGDDVEGDEVVDWGEPGNAEVDEVEAEVDVDVDEVEVRRTILAVVIYGGWSRRRLWKFWV